MFRLSISQFQGLRSLQIHNLLDQIMIQLILSHMKHNTVRCLCVGASYSGNFVVKTG